MPIKRNSQLAQRISSSREAEQVRLHAAVRVVGGSGQGAAADGRDVHALLRVGEPAQIPQQHHDVGHQIMAEGDRLGPLEVGIAGHDARLVLLGPVGERRGQVPHQAGYGIALLLQVHAHVQRDLIVAAAGGVELFARVADALGEHLLHEHMDVLAAGIHRQGAAADIREDLAQAGAQLVALGVGDDAPGREHGGVGHAAADVLGVQALVKADGGVEVVRQGIGIAGGYTGPHLSHNKDPFCGISCAPSDAQDGFQSQEVCFIE